MTSTAPPAPAPQRSRADAYLPEEPLLILHAAADAVTALVTDTRETWRTSWAPETGWACSCPARTNACGHIAALRSIIVLEH